MYGFDTVNYEREDAYQMDNEAEPIFFNSHEMTTFPSYDNQAVTAHARRKQERFSPYRGYFEDMRNVSAKCNQEPSPNLINSYLKKSWVEHSQGATQVTFIETNAMRRYATFNEKLADKLLQRHNLRKAAKIFAKWYQYSFRYIIIRRQLLDCFLTKYMGVRFYAWRHVTRVSAKFRVCLKRYWRKHRLLRFRWWKVWTQWQNVKLRMFRNYFNIVNDHKEYTVRIQKKLGRFVSRYFIHCAARTIQWQYHRHRLRYFFWCTRVVKRTFMKKFSLWLIKRRKKEEDLRQLSEDAACAHMVERAHLYLQKLLQKKDGKTLLWVYIREVTDRWDDKENRDLVFPSKQDMPEIGMKWTVRGKAMHILRHRTTLEVHEWAKINFRESSPPHYSCAKCLAKFPIRSIYREHIAYCSYEYIAPKYLAWRLSQPLVDAALGPLVTHFYRQKAAEMVQRDERLQEQKKMNAALLNQALRGSAEAPKYEHIRVKEKSPSKRGLYQS